MEFIEINPKTFEGFIPSEYDLVIVEKNDKEFDTAMVLYGFDEFGEFDNEFINPIYGFLKF